MLYKGKAYYVNDITGTSPLRTKLTPQNERIKAVFVTKGYLRFVTHENAIEAIIEEELS